MSTEIDTLRLLKPYRGYGVGAVIRATRRLAEQLVADGYAVQDNWATGLEHQSAERAVASQPAIETR
jgi:hypothetical protein